MLNKIDGKLKIAICAGNIEKIEKYIEEGADVNATDANGNHPLNWLHDTPKAKRDGVASFLLQHGADPLVDGNQGDIPLSFLLKKRCYKAWSIFLQQCKEKDKLDDLMIEDISVVVYTLHYGDRKSFKLLVDILENEDWQQQIDLEILRILLDKRKYIFAKALLEYDFAKELLTDENKKLTFLKGFIGSDEPAHVEFFVDKFKPDFSTIDEHGNNCLHYVACESAIEVMDAFVKHEAILNAQNNQGDTPLMLALTEIIIQQSNLEMSSDDETNALSEMVDEEKAQNYRSRIKIIKKLLAAGVSTLLQANAGNTAVSLAQQLKGREKKLAELIIEHSKIEQIYKEFLEYQQILTPEQKSTIKKHVDLQHAKHTELDVKEYEGVTDIQKEFSKKPYLAHMELRVYELIECLKKKDPSYKLPIQERHTKKHLLDSSVYYYTFLNSSPYRLTCVNSEAKDEKGIAAHIANQLITTLVYEGYRHKWSHETCQLHHKLIAKIDKKYANFDFDKYKQAIAKQEEISGNYFSEYLSDNSDSDEEDKFQQLSNRKKVILRSAARPLYERSQAEEKLLTQKKELKKGEPKYDRSLRQKIIRNVEVSDQAQRDLEKLNMLAITGRLDEKSIKTISTKFFIAQYRGICYSIDEWNQDGRRQHRLIKEEKQPQFSRAVLAEAGYEKFNTYFESTQNADEKIANNSSKKLLNIAVHLQDQLFQLKNSGPVKVKLTGNAAYFFDNALEALQDLYTKNYKLFHETLTKFSAKFNKASNDNSSDATVVNELAQAIFLSVNNKFNFFVSTSDTPEHALRYAYGDKYYEAYKEYRLRPRWRIDGTVERPYSGKAYISLHEPLELFTSTHHIVSLNQEGKIHIDLQTVTERETSFMAYLPPERVIGQHIAKFPSFKGAYKEIYLEKYGLTLELYEKFKNNILATKPHTKERKQIVKLLTEHLVSYYEVCLIEEANVTASQKGGVLIYRNEHGGFSLFPCQSKEISRSSNNERQTAASAVHEQTAEKREDRKAKPMPSTSFFPSTLVKYKFIANKTTLISSLSFLLKTPELELETLEQKPESRQFNLEFFVRPKETTAKQSFNKSYNLLKEVANKYKKKIYLHSPAIKDYQTLIEPDGKAENDSIHLYYVGGDKYLAMQPISLAIKQDLNLKAAVMLEDDKELQDKEHQEKTENIPSPIKKRKSESDEETNSGHKKVKTSDQKQQNSEASAKKVSVASPFFTRKVVASSPVSTSAAAKAVSQDIRGMPAPKIKR